jgi:5-methyltetrahydrofolate--homocysteine methyltransferase
MPIPVRLPSGVATFLDPTLPMRRDSMLADALSRRILLLDGAMRTTMFANHGPDLEGDNDILVLTRPDVIGAIHADYFAAGSDIIETNTFGGTAIAQADYGLEAAVYDLNVAGARLARQVADEGPARTPDRPRFVAGAIGWMAPPP